jgi:hypothetical protein
MLKARKQFPAMDILFKSSTFSLATESRAVFPRKMQTRSIQKSFAPFLTDLANPPRTPISLPVPHF